MRTLWSCLAVLLGGVLMFMAGAGFAAEGYSAFSWPADWGKRSEDYRFGYAAGVMDTIIYMEAVGVPGASLGSAYACVRNTKGLTNGTVAKTVDAQLANNPKFGDAVAVAVIEALNTCKVAAPTGNAVNLGNTLRRK
jgi:hypothetical protein